MSPTPSGGAIVRDQSGDTITIDGANTLSASWSIGSSTPFDSGRWVGVLNGSVAMIPTPYYNVASSV